MVIKIREVDANREQLADESVEEAEIVEEEIVDEKKLKDISDEKLRQFKVDLSGMSEWSRAEDLYLAVEKELDRRALDKE